MKILMLTKYPASGPSSRYRFLQYLPALTAAGHRVTVQPFFDDAYLRALFSGRRVSPVYLLRRCLARLGHGGGGRRFDLAWVEGELMPFLPAGWERLLHPLLPRRRIYDFDDAVWLRYQGKRFLERKFPKILASAAGVTAGNIFLQAYAQAGCPRSLLLPTVVDWTRYEHAESQADGRTIGWIGSPSTAFFLDVAAPALCDLYARTPFKLKVVGAQVAYDGFEMENAPWSLAGEVPAVASFDVGIMPLVADAWSEGKCGLKLVQYLAAGVPAVASPVGVNTHFLQASGGGYLAADREEWVFHLGKLLENPSLRQRMGENGRDWVRAEMTVQVQAPRLIRFLENTP